MNRSKRSSLGDALRQASGKADPVAAAAKTPPPVKADRPPWRRGKKTIGAWFDVAVSHQLKLIALEDELKSGTKTNVQELLREAINDLFEKRGKGRIA